MPPESDLPSGPHREFVEELFVHYREAGRPPLRQIAKWIDDNKDTRDLRGTASTETIRKVLQGRTLPRLWFTVETVLEALCGIAGRETSEKRWPNDWMGETFEDVLKQRWNAAIDHGDGPLPSLPPRPSPQPVRPRPDPWASPAGKVGGFDSFDEAPF